MSIDVDTMSIAIDGAIAIERRSSPRASRAIVHRSIDRSFVRSIDRHSSMTMTMSMTMSTRASSSSSSSSSTASSSSSPARACARVPSRATRRTPRANGHKNFCSFDLAFIAKRSRATLKARAFAPPFASTASNVVASSSAAASTSMTNDNDGERTDVMTNELLARAMKVPMYSVGAIPIACASALVYLRCGRVDWGVARALALGAACVIAWLNLSNDAWDSSTTVDERKPESVVRLMKGNVLAVHAMAWTALAIGASALYFACAASGNARAWKLLLGATALGHAYQGPPFRLSYKGLGEPIAFVAFGPMATVAFYIALCGATTGGAPVAITPVVLSVAVLVGCTTAFILFTSHFHQEEGDRAAGKMSPVVRLGLPQALLLADNLVGAHYACVATLAAAGWLPYTAVFGLVVTYPIARHIVDYAQQKLDANDIDALFFTKYLAVRWHIVHGVALALGVVAQRAFLSPDLFI